MEEVIDTKKVSADLAVHFNTDNRYPIKDTTTYPNNAIAKLRIQFYSDEKDYVGTAFLADKTILYTNAHNVRKYPENRPARSVQVIFGLSESSPKSKVFVFTGNDFFVPSTHKEPTDHADIAWLDLKKYKTLNSTDWQMKDLPTKSFITAKIPAVAGTYKQKFIICGNLNT